MHEHCRRSSMHSQLLQAKGQTDPSSAFCRFDWHHAWDNCSSGWLPC